MTRCNESNLRYLGSGTRALAPPALPLSHICLSAPLVDSNFIHSGSALLMLLTVAFVGLVAFFIYKFKRFDQKRRRMVNRQLCTDEHIRSARPQENPLDPRPDGGDQRKGAWSDQHGCSRRHHVQGQAQRVPVSERAHGEGAGGQEPRYAGHMTEIFTRCCWM